MRKEKFKLEFGIQVVWKRKIPGKFYMKHWDVREWLRNLDPF
jgi:hypothetical protein